MKVHGFVKDGVGHFKVRMTDYANVFTEATGEVLFPGTLNVKVDRTVPFKEDFRIRGADIGEPEQDLIFEKCQINGIAAYRIRPLNLLTGKGGHGDDHLEIGCTMYLREVLGLRNKSQVEITFFRD